MSPLLRTTKVLTNGSVMFGGSSLRIVYSDNPADRLVPDFLKGEISVQASERKRIRELIRRWFLRESSAYVVKKVRELAPAIGVRPTRVDVREIGKWGYCTRNGRLSFSWQLIALPERLREYVVVHELVHLLEFNHSRAFRERVADYCPDFLMREKELDAIVPYDRLAWE